MNLCEAVEQRKTRQYLRRESWHKSKPSISCHTGRFLLDTFGRPSYELTLEDLAADDWCVLNATYVKETKTVWQWRYSNADQKHWKVAQSLLTEDEAAEYYIGCTITKHAGPFEVPE